MKEIVLPDSITELEGSVFSFCKNLSKVQLSKKIDMLPYSLFESCEPLEEISIPDNIKHIGNTVFWNCTNLKSVVLSNNLKTIGAKAFANCTSLEEIFIPNSVIEIGREAFSGCSNLKKIHMSENIESIGYDIFAKCKNIESIANIEKIIEIDKKLVNFLPNYKNSKLLPDGFNTKINLDDITERVITNSSELTQYLDEKISKYCGFTILNIFYDYVIKGHDRNKIAKTYNLSTEYVDNRLEEMAKEVKIDYLDQYCVPIQYTAYNYLSLIKDFYNPTPVDLNYIYLKIEYLLPEEIHLYQKKLKLK